MTGDEHYREAERLLAEIAKDAARQRGTLIGHQPQYTADLLMRAQAHATLALAATTHETGTKEGTAARIARGRFGG